MSGLHFPAAATAVPSEPAQLLYETLLDGELVVSDGGKIAKFLVFDCLMCGGKVLTQRPLTSRLGHLKELVLKPHHHHYRHSKTMPPILVALKHMQFAYNVADVIK